VRFTFRICENGLSDVSVCFAGGIAALIPAVGGQSLDFNLCLGIPGVTRALQASGGITNLTWGSASPCALAQDLNPMSNLGTRPATFKNDCCADADLSVRIRGVAFDRPFDVGGRVAEIRPFCPLQDINNFRVVVRAFIPSNYAESPNLTDSCVPPGGSLQRLLVFGGDERGFEPDPDPKSLPPVNPQAFRLEQEVTLVPEQFRDADGEVTGSRLFRVGETIAYAEDALVDGRITPADWDPPHFGDCHLAHAHAAAEPTRSWEVQRLSPNMVTCPATISPVH
jgi:hypothetical protein